MRLRLAIALCTAVVGLAATTSSPAAAPTSLPTSASVVAKTCSRGYVHAIIGGAESVLHAGQFCSVSKASQYRRYGFVCKHGSDGRYRLYKRR